MAIPPWGDGFSSNPLPTKSREPDIQWQTSNFPFNLRWKGGAVAVYYNVNTLTFETIFTYINKWAKENFKTYKITSITKRLSGIEYLAGIQLHFKSLTDAMAFKIWWGDGRNELTHAFNLVEIEKQVALGNIIGELEKVK